jgi:hypothetical protein
MALGIVLRYTQYGLGRPHADDMRRLYGRKICVAMFLEVPALRNECRLFSNSIVHATLLLIR